MDPWEISNIHKESLIESSLHAWDYIKRLGLKNWWNNFELNRSVLYNSDQLTRKANILSKIAYVFLDKNIERYEEVEIIKNFLSNLGYDDVFNKTINQDENNTI